MDEKKNTAHISVHYSNEICEPSLAITSCVAFSFLKIEAG